MEKNHQIWFKFGEVIVEQEKKNSDQSRTSSLFEVKLKKTFNSKNVKYFLTIILPDRRMEMDSLVRGHC